MVNDAELPTRRSRPIFLHVQPPPRDRDDLRVEPSYGVAAMDEHTPDRFGIVVQKLQEVPDVERCRVGGVFYLKRQEPAAMFDDEIDFPP